MKNLLAILSLVGMLGYPLYASADLITSLGSYYKMDEGSGSTTADSIAGNTFNLQGTGEGWTTVGKINKGVATGASGNASTTTSTAFDETSTKSFTACVWAYNTSAFGSNHMLISKGTNQWNLVMGANSGQLQAAIPGVANILTGNSFATNAYFYDCLVHIGGSPSDTWLLYQNASNTASVTQSANTMTSNSLRLTLGAEAGVTTPTLQFIGRLDEFGFWNRALSGAEILALYTATAGCQYPFGACNLTFAPWQNNDF